MTQRNPSPDNVEQLVLTWSTELLEAQASGDDNFLDLGGHSALALDLISRIKEHFNVDLDLQLLFEHSFSEVAADVVRRAEIPVPRG
ncbi:phosphopantetheine-binding protein [Streptomyces sp. NPDC091279]|uniref:phosphopantetheine-binding protein n=1 Tax=unclassified Streptomyces TaxID=2593676 RepID=UPI00380A2650